MTAERPWMKFYPQDWRADEMLRNCSLAARGLWIEMLAIMHRSERYGHLLINGKAPPDQALAIQSGAAIDEVREALAELESEGVFSRDKDGTIFSRRMIRDEIRHRRASTFGKRGVRAKAMKEKDETPTLEGMHEGSLQGGHKGTLQPRDQRPDIPPLSPKLKGQGKRPLPGDWEPEEFGEGTSCRSIVDGWTPLELERQLERFRAHHERDGNRYANWQAAWKTWVLNSVTFAERDERRQPQRHGSDLVESILAKEAARSG